MFRKDPREDVKYDRISELLIESGADVNFVLHEVAQYGRYIS